MKITEILNEIIEEEKINLLLEVFDKIGELPENLRQEGNIFYFEFDNLRYYVEFKEFDDVTKSRSISDENKLILNKIKDKKYIVEFGIINEEGKNSTITLKNSNSIKVLNYIVSIIDLFNKINNVNVFSYHIEDMKRYFVYDKIFKRLFQDKYTKIGDDKIFRNVIYVKTSLL